MVYFDISMFKPLNDQLGYRVGDQVILLLTDLLIEHFHNEDDFVGHICGDDFVVISPSSDAIDLTHKVQTQFVDQTRRFYAESTLQKGFVESEDRNGHQDRFPLVSLAAGIIAVGPENKRTAEQLADAASYAKKRAKVSPDFCFIESTMVFLREAQA